jgi:hypothetical protein
MENELNKQTAVNYLIKEFSDILGPIETKPMQDLLIMAAIKQAKEMEKEQMFNSFMAFESNTEENEKLFDEYYKETYGGKDGK